MVKINDNRSLKDDEENSESISIMEEESGITGETIPKKVKKRGIIYLSNIPPYMNVTKVREIFGEFGTVCRVFLQPSLAADEEKTVKKRKHYAKHFEEGWVEFDSKRKAKLVAQTLNNKRIGSRKKSKFYDCIWNIKYLPRFKWVHLSERLAYEKAAHKQKMRAEISQAKVEATKFGENLERSEKYKKYIKKTESSSKS